MHYATKEWGSKSRHATTHQQPCRVGYGFMQWVNLKVT